MASRCRPAALPGAIACRNGGSKYGSSGGDASGHAGGQTELSLPVPSSAQPATGRKSFPGALTRPGVAPLKVLVDSIALGTTAAFALFQLFVESRSITRNRSGSLRPNDAFCQLITRKADPARLHDKWCAVPDVPM